MLTAREHYIAHALLEKAFITRYGLHHYKTKKMKTIKQYYEYCQLNGLNPKEGESLEQYKRTCVKNARVEN